MISKKQTYFLGLFLILFYSTSGLHANEQKEENDDDYEKILVTGQFTPEYYKEVMLKAEVDFFDNYNSLTKHEDFKITCFRKTISKFSRLTTRVCEAGYISGEKHKATQHSLSSVTKRNAMKGNMEHTKASVDVHKAQKKRREEQLKEMEELINSNPDLYAKYAALQKAKQDYKQAMEDSE